MRRKPEQWQKLVQSQRQSGLSMAAFCREQGLREKSFYYWHQKWPVAEKVSPDFIRVSCAKPAPITSRPHSLHFGSSELRLTTDTSPQWLAELMRALA